jgi:hypothetical protein
MPSFGGIKKYASEWTQEERRKYRALHRQFEEDLIRKRKAQGFDLQLISIPLPTIKTLRKYQKDTALKKELAEYQVINPYKLKQDVWEDLVLNVD